MADIYVALIKKGLRKIDDIPDETLREQVRKMLNEE